MQALPSLARRWLVCMPILGMAAIWATAQAPPRPALEYRPELVAELIKDARQQGDARRGAAVFRRRSSPASRCHKVGKHGGVDRAGPDDGRQVPDARADRRVGALAQAAGQGRVTGAQPSSPTDGKVHPGLQGQRETTRSWCCAIRPRRDRSAIAQGRHRGAPRAGHAHARRPGRGDDRRSSAATCVRFLIELGTAPTAWRDLVAAHASHAGDVAHRPRAARPEHWPSWQHPGQPRPRSTTSTPRRPSTSASSRRCPCCCPRFPASTAAARATGATRTTTTWADDRWNQTDLGTLPVRRLPRRQA